MIEKCALAELRPVTASERRVKKRIVRRVRISYWEDIAEVEDCRQKVWVV
jgi:hypothetical protein